MSGGWVAAGEVRGVNGQGADCVKPFGTLRAFSHLSLVSQKGRRTE